MTPLMSSGASKHKRCFAAATCIQTAPPLHQVPKFRITQVERNACGRLEPYSETKVGALGKRERPSVPPVSRLEGVSSQEAQAPLRGAENASL